VGNGANVEPYADMDCRISIDSGLTLDALAAQLAAKLMTRVSELPFEKTLTTAVGEMSLRKNDEYASERTREVNGFLYYRYGMEFYPRPGATLPERIETVAAVLRALASLDVRAVAACDYEDRLPNDGRVGSNALS